MKKTTSSMCVRCGGQQKSSVRVVLNECTQENVQTVRYAKVVIAELQGKLDNLSAKLSNEYSDRGWVLCTEKLPEHSGAYLRTVRRLEDNYLWSEELIYYHETNSWFLREEPELFEVYNE